MRIKQVVLMGGLLCLCSLLFAIGVHAEDDSANNRVTATFTIRFETGTDLNVDITMDVQRFTTDKTYTGDEIKTLSNAEEMGAIKYGLFILIKNQLKGLFGDANLANFSLPAYTNQKFTETLDVTLASTFFSLNESIQARTFINGLLDMDAIILYTFEFHAEQGWNNTYQVVLPTSMIFRNTTGIVNGQIIQWELENWNGAHPTKKGWMSLQYVNPTTPKSTTEDISLDFTLDTSSVKTTTFNTVIAANSIDISPYNIVPTGITNVNIIPADGIRLFIEYGFLSWDTLYQRTLHAIEQTITTTIENSPFSQHLDLAFRWNPETTINCSTPFSTTHMDSMPPIKASLTDDQVTLRLFNLSAKAVFGLANAGAISDVSASDVNFGNDLNKINLPYTCFLILPTNIYLAGKNTYSWNSTIPLSGELSSSQSPTYTKEEKTMLVTIEITKMDLDLLSIFTGKTALSAPVSATEQNNLYVTTIPSEFSLPEKIFLPYLNSDAFRLCVEENVFNNTAVTAFLTHSKEQFEARLSSMLHDLKISGNIERNAFADSLIWDGDIAKMDKITPVIVASTAHCIYPVPFALSIAPPAFNISSQTFTLTGFSDRDVTYRFIFPKGIAVSASDSLNNQITFGKTPAGLGYLELSLGAAASPVTDTLSFTMAAEPLYILGLLLPCILTFILVIVLIIVIYLIRRKRGPIFVRKEKKPRAKKEDTEEEEGFEGQEYYVPPAPGSKK